MIEEKTKISTALSKVDLALAVRVEPVLLAPSITTNQVPQTNSRRLVGEGTHPVRLVRRGATLQATRDLSRSQRNSFMRRVDPWIQAYLSMCAKLNSCNPLSKSIPQRTLTTPHYRIDQRKKTKNRHQDVVLVFRLRKNKRINNASVVGVWSSLVILSILNQLSSPTYQLKTIRESVSLVWFWAPDH